MGGGRGEGERFRAEALRGTPGLRRHPKQRLPQLPWARRPARLPDCLEDAGGEAEGEGHGGVAGAGEAAGLQHAGALKRLRLGGSSGKQPPRAPACTRETASAGKAGSRPRGGRAGGGDACRAQPGRPPKPPRPAGASLPCGTRGSTAEPAPHQASPQEPGSRRPPSPGWWPGSASGSRCSGGQAARPPLSGRPAVRLVNCDGTGRGQRQPTLCR